MLGAHEHDFRSCLTDWDPADRSGGSREESRDLGFLENLACLKHFPPTAPFHWENLTTQHNMQHDLWPRSKCGLSLRTTVINSRGNRSIMPQMNRRNYPSHTRKHYAQIYKCLTRTKVPIWITQHWLLWWGLIWDAVQCVPAGWNSNGFLGWLIQTLAQGWPMLSAKKEVTVSEKTDKEK